jgi:4-hydroxy-3-polyprenylbenzoate decarboxylase
VNEAGARVVVGLTGATGAVYAVRLLERLREAGRETHLVASPAGVLNVHHENGLDRKGLEALADASYNPSDIGAAIASGSFATAGMVIAPLLDEDARRRSRMATPTTSGARRRRDPQGTASAGLDGSRDAVQPGPSAQHDRGDRDGRHRVPAVAGLLPSSADHRDLVDDTVERVLALLGIESAAPKSWSGL